MNRTGIEYGDYGWNFYPGCDTKCSYCWAQKSLKRMKCEECKTGKPHYHYDRVIQPFSLRKPSRILVNFLGDFMGDWIPDEVKQKAFNVMGRTPRHTYLILTKKPQNLVKWSPFPGNCYVGVSATDAGMFYDATMYLSKIEAKVKYISFEPLLESINGGECEGKRLDLLKDAGISWVIIGAQTKPTVMPEIAWVQEIVEAAAGIPVFLKKNLLPIFGKYLPEWACFTQGPNSGLLRQEMPKGV